MADELTGRLRDIYRDLHTHPELSFQEHRTARIAAGWLKDLGFEVIDGIATTGVAGVLRNGDGPTVLLRADMDALPVREATGLPYASGVDGVMHACGHDMHVTCLLGAASELSASREDWSGTVLAVFQPAEELGQGAASMVADRLFERASGLQDIARIVGGLPSNHSPLYAPVEDPTIRIGVGALSATAREWLASRHTGQRKPNDQRGRRD
jgi:amidohydrolase